MKKTFSKPDSLLSIDGFIYLVDTKQELEVRENDYYTSHLGDVRQAKMTYMEEDGIKRPFLNTDLWSFPIFKIIASNNPSLKGVAKIGELPDTLKEVWISATLDLVTHDIPGERGREISRKGLIRLWDMASSKKKYTEDDMRKAINKAIINGPLYSTILNTPEDLEKIQDDIIQSLKPSPISIEMEMEGAYTELQEAHTGIPPKKSMVRWPITVPKLKDGYVIIKEVKYE